MPPHRSLLPALAALAALPLVACGDSADSSHTSPRGRAALSFMAAMADSDTTKACFLMTPASRTRAAQELGAISCPVALRFGLLHLGGQGRAALRRFELGEVETRGSIAVVHGTAPGDDTLTLRRIGGRWLVDAYR